MQQPPQSPTAPLHEKQRTSSFHSLFNLTSLSPLRTFLIRAPSSSASSSPPSTATPVPRIPQIHPGEYHTYKSVNKLLSTFTSRSIAQKRRTEAKADLPLHQDEDTYRSIHCGDQNCCFSSPYSFYRTRSTPSSSTTRSKILLRGQSRSRSVSNPNLRHASPGGGEDSSLASPPSSLSTHPFRRSLTITGSSRRASSLFSGSPPPPGKSLSPLYEYPDPIGPRSSSWLNREMGMEVERSKSVTWGPGVFINRHRVASQFYRPSGLSLFSWTAEDAKSCEMNGKEGKVDNGEREIAYEWDGAFGWTQACKECGRERCVKCSGEVFEQIVVEGETLTGEEGMFSICTPCIHGFCPGTKMWLRIKCKRCGEVGCEGCEDLGAGEG
ncbi:hypothetical protein OCU04_001797 [Sclerotinia nivalis]|uniref:Uncharacterized protein n=1 Tax=Sclerotinia nivalis TaxID=352851 RepID=A0A9X0DRD3_9HELO|nr:hypothetical protein OCU04_001797 [Sclerotinia nivalis]